MAEPLFDPSERVSTTELPAEIRNEKDPAKIAAYYQRREAALREEMRRQSAQPTPTRVTVERPTDPTPQPVTFSAEEATAARGTLTATARQAAKVGKKYWDRLSDDIEKIMKDQPPENQVSSVVWETAYNTLVGMNLERLQKEDTEAAATAQRIATERSAAQPALGETPAPLPVEVTSKVLPGLGIDEKQYREAQDRIASGKWPLTAENVSGKRVEIGGR